MLSFVRALGFLAPLAVAAFVTVALGVAAYVPESQRPALIAVLAVAAAAGMTTMALVAWSYFGWRLGRIANALERALETDRPTELRVMGIPAERRLARAFNTAAGAYLQTEARATHDRLTGVANRETLLGTLATEVDRASRHYKPLSVAFIDIDRFKRINDTHGHNSGDAVLRQVAEVLSGSIRASDSFGRYGGEEFMLILPETLPEDAVGLAEELRSLVMSQQFTIANNETLKATISIGIAGGRGSELQLDMLVDRADAAMYAAKSLGRNRVYLYRELDEESLVRRAPISAQHQAQATAIGQWANDTATQALASVLAPQPQHRGRPSDMIASLATGLALEMGLPHEEIERIRIASLLHDLGKIAIPEEILDKPSTLSDAEWQTIGEHPRIGQVILEQATTLREAIPVVLHHHERYNGGRRGGRRLPRHGPRPAVQRSRRPREGARGAAQPCRHAVRPGRRRCLLRDLWRRRPAGWTRGGLSPARARSRRAPAPRGRRRGARPSASEWKATTRPEDRQAAGRGRSLGLIRRWTGPSSRR